MSTQPNTPTLTERAIDLNCTYKLLSNGITIFFVCFLAIFLTGYSLDELAICVLVLYFSGVGFLAARIDFENNKYFKFCLAQAEKEDTIELVDTRWEYQSKTESASVYFKQHGIVEITFSNGIDDLITGLWRIVGRNLYLTNCNNKPLLPSMLTVSVLAKPSNKSSLLLYTSPGQTIDLRPVKSSL